MISATSIYRQSPDLVLRNIANEAILVPVRNRVGDLDAVFTLSEVALAVWNLLDGRRTISELARTISHDFDVTEEVAADDIAELLGTLTEANLVLPAETAA